MRGLSLSPVQGRRLRESHDIKDNSPNKLFETLNLSPRPVQGSQLSGAGDIERESIKRFLETLNASFFEKLETICPDFNRTNTATKAKELSKLFLSTVIALQNFKDHHLVRYGQDSLPDNFVHQEIQKLDNNTGRFFATNVKLLDAFFIIKDSSDIFKTIKHAFENKMNPLRAGSTLEQVQDNISSNFDHVYSAMELDTANDHQIAFLFLIAPICKYACEASTFNSDFFKFFNPNGAQKIEKNLMKLNLLIENKKRGGKGISNDEKAFLQGKKCFAFLSEKINHELAHPGSKNEEDIAYLRNLSQVLQNIEKFCQSFTHIEHQLLTNDDLKQYRQAAMGFVPVAEETEAALVKLAISPVPTLSGSSSSSRGTTSSPELGVLS